MSRQFISFGKNTFDSSKFNKIKNDAEKPLYGLWACDFTPDAEFYSAWEKWAVAEDLTSSPYLRNAITFEIAETSRVFIINNKNDLYELLRRYPLLKTIPSSKLNRATSIREYFDVIDEIYIDFEKMSEDFDAIEISPIACQDIIHTDSKTTIESLGIQLPENHKAREHYSLSYSSWDIPSICIFNPDVVTNVKHFVNDHVRFDRSTTEEIISDLIAQGRNDEQIYSELASATSDDIDLTTCIQNVRDKIAQEKAYELARDNAYKQKIVEYAPVFLELKKASAAHTQKMKQKLTDFEIDSLLADINETNCKYINLCKELYKIKTGSSELPYWSGSYNLHQLDDINSDNFMDCKPLTDFSVTMEQDFLAELEKQLQKAQADRDTASTEKQAAQNRAKQLAQEGGKILSE